MFTFASNLPVFADEHSLISRKFGRLSDNEAPFFNDRDASQKEIEYFSNQLQNLRSIEETLRSAVPVDTDIVLLGESHGTISWKNDYPHLLRMLKIRLPKLKYIFIEAPAAHQGDFDKYFAGEIKFRDYYGGRVGLWVSPQVIDTAKELGLDIKLVDAGADSYFPGPSEIDNLKAINKRNQTMASEIAKYLREGGVGVFIGGADHLKTNVRLPGDKSIPENLSESHLHPVSIRLMGQTTYPLKEFGGGVRIEKEGGFIPSGSNDIYLPRYWLFNANETNALPAAERKLILARNVYWNEFDAVLVFPGFGKRNEF